MLPFKEGDKFIIEIGTVYEKMEDHSLPDERPYKTYEHLYRVKNFGTMVFDEWALSQLDRYSSAVGPYGIGCICRISRDKPKSRKEWEALKENGWPAPNPAWMITEVEKKEDGGWIYKGIQRDGEQIEVDNTVHITYLNTHYNTVREWAACKTVFPGEEEK